MLPCASNLHPTYHSYLILVPLLWGLHFFLRWNHPRLPLSTTPPESNYLFKLFLKLLSIAPPGTCVSTYTVSETPPGNSLCCNLIFHLQALEKLTLPGQFDPARSTISQHSYLGLFPPLVSVEKYAALLHLLTRYPLIQEASLLTPSMLLILGRLFCFYERLTFCFTHLEQKPCDCFNLI